MGEYGVGQSVPREEDPYLVRGAGRYVDDAAQAGTLRAYVLRSPHAHARIRAIDAKAAKSMPGVALVLAGDDPAVTALGTQKPNQPRKRRGGEPAFGCSQFALARDTVRYIGEPVAFVAAETLHQAKDAAEAITVDYETLAAVPTLEEATRPGATAVYDKCPDNVAFVHEAGNRAA